MSPPSSAWDNGRSIPHFGCGSACWKRGRMQKIGPKHRMCRRVGAAVCGRPNCPTAKRPFPPGQHGRGRKRLTEFHIRLLEKQKLRAIYGVGERQFRRYFHEASRKKTVT